MSSWGFVYLWLVAELTSMFYVLCGVPKLTNIRYVDNLTSVAFLHQRKMGFVFWPVLKRRTAMKRKTSLLARLGIFAVKPP